MHDILSYLTRNTYGRLTSNYNVFNNEDTNENDTTDKSKINCKIKKENTLKKDKHYIYYTKDHNHLSCLCFCLQIH